MPTVSIITPTYNRAGMLKEAIESVLAQTYQDWEHLIVDDGSTDGTMGLVTRYAGQDPRIRYVRRRNGGLPAARNTGLLAARGEYVAFLDDDDRFLPKKLERQLSMLRQRPELGFVYAPVWVHYDDRSERMPIIPDRFATTFAELIERSAIQVCSVLVRRTALDAVGGFNERYRGCADYDLWLRLAARFPFDYTPEPVGIYHRHSNNMSMNATTMLAERLMILLSMVEWRRFGVSDALRRRVLATTAYQLARYQLEARKFFNAAASFMRAARWRPDVGLLAKPHRGGVSQGRLRKIVKPYLGIAYCLWRGVAHAGR